MTEAPFSTRQLSSVGSVKIDTRRRRQLKGEQRQLTLGDRFGAVLWQEQLGKGRAIFSTTPHLAANAYQDYLGNYTYLAQSIDNGNLLFVDEYIHGYKDPAVRESDAEQDLVSYLAQTPVFPALLQGGVLLLILIWAQNRRFGPPVALDIPVVDNSKAYIQALAEVLQKAECSEFVLDMVGKEEQLQLLKILGLGQIPLDHQTVVQHWVQQTGRSATELEQLLRVQSRKRGIRHKDLLTWLGKWQTIQLKSKK